MPWMISHLLLEQDKLKKYACGAGWPKCSRSGWTNVQPALLRHILCTFARWFTKHLIAVDRFRNVDNSFEKYFWPTCSIYWAGWSRVWSRMADIFDDFVLMAAQVLTAKIDVELRYGHVITFLHCETYIYCCPERLLLIAITLVKCFECDPTMPTHSSWTQRDHTHIHEHVISVIAAAVIIYKNDDNMKKTLFRIGVYKNSIST